MSGKINNRACKVTGKYKNSSNVLGDDGTMECIDFSKDVRECELLDDNAEVLVLYDSVDVFKAKENELENWRNNEVYDEVDIEGQEQGCWFFWFFEEKKQKPMVKKNTFFMFF